MNPIDFRWDFLWAGLYSFINSPQAKFILRTKGSLVPDNIIQHERSAIPIDRTTVLIRPSIVQYIKNLQEPPAGIY